MTNKTKILKDIFSYSSSSYISQGVGLLSGLIIASKLGPEDYGIYNAVTLVLGYAAYSELGVLSTMSRDLPFHIGQSNLQKSKDIDSAARYMTFIGAVCASIIIFYFSLFLSISPKMAFGLRIMSLVVIFQQIYTYHRTILRCNNNFKELSQQQIILSIISAIITILFVEFSGFNGRMLAALILQFLILLYAIYRNPWKESSKFDFATIFGSIKTGLPILASGFIITLVTSIDRLMIVTFLGATSLGYFGLSIMLISVISLIPAMTSQVLYPRISYHFGQSGKNIDELSSYVIKPPIILSAILPFLIGPIILSLPFVINLFLPAFIPGISAARIVVSGIYFYGILGLTDYFLVTTGKLKLYALFGIIALIINIIFDFIFIKMGLGIEGIAFGGTLLTYLIYSSIVIGYAVSFYKKSTFSVLLYFLKLWMPFFYMISIIWSIEFIFEHFLINFLFNFSFFSVILKILIYLIACMPFKSIITKETNLDLSYMALVNLVKNSKL